MRDALSRGSQTVCPIPALSRKLSSAMPETAHSPACRKALALIRASGHVIVDADLGAPDLVTLAAAAAQWGASLTVRNAQLRSEDELADIATVGRGHVTFDLAE